MKSPASFITPINDDDSACERTCAKLLIYPGEVKATEISARMGIEPTSTVEKGMRQGPNSLGRFRTGKVNGWFLSSEGVVSSKDVRRHLNWLLDRLEPAAAALTALQGTEGVRMRVDCVWWSAKGGGGPVLWPEQMRRLAELNLECGFDLAYYGEQDDVE